MKRYGYRILLCSVLLLSTLAQAGTVEQVVVTGALVPVARANLPSTITVIDRIQIERLQKKSVLDILRTVPGLLVTQEGGAGGVSAVSLRGAEANFTVVLLDGVQVNNPTDTRGGAFDFDSLAVAAVERIEIVRGAQSAIYGSDALAGVINVITRATTEETVQRLAGEVGEGAYYQADFSASGSLGQSAYALSLHQKDAGEPVAGSSLRASELAARWKLSFGEKTSISAALRYADSDSGSYPEQSGGPKLATSDQLDSRKATDTSINLQLTHQLRPDWRSLFRTEAYTRGEENFSPGIAPYSSVPPNFSDNDYEFWRASWINSLEITSSLSINAGLDHKSEQGSSSGYVEFFGQRLPTDFELQRDSLGVFADARYQHNGGVSVELGVRSDEPDGFSREQTWRAGINGRLVESLRIYGNWGQAYKLPSFFALGNALVGNPDLQPESATSWDVGVQWHTSSTVFMSLSVFQYDYENLVDFDPDTFSSVNRSNIETQGYEISVRWNPVQTVSLAVNTTYIDIDSDEEVTLTGRPEWKVGLTTSWNFLPEWSFALNAEWVDKSLATTLYSGATQVLMLDPYSRFDGNIQWQFNPLVRVVLSVDNISDKEYQQAVGFPGPGRQGRFKLEWRF